MSRQEVKNFVVVEFILRGRRITKSIDTVLKSWIHVDKQLKCYYPPKGKWHEVPSLVSTLQAPDKETWELSAIKCRYNTDDYDIANDIVQLLAVYDDIPANRQDIIDKLGYQNNELEKQIRQEHLLTEAEMLNAEFLAKSEQRKAAKSQPSGNNINKKQATKKSTDANDKTELFETNDQDETAYDVSEACKISIIEEKLKAHLEKSETINLNDDEKGKKRPMVNQFENPKRSRFLDQSHHSVIDKGSAADFSSQAATASSGDEYDDDQKLESNGDLKRLLSHILKKTRRIETVTLSNRKDIKAIKKNVDIMQQCIENNKIDSGMNSDYLTSKYSIAFPVKSRDELDTLERKLKKEPQFQSEIETVMKNLIHEVTDLGLAARIIAKKFLIHDVASQFVTQLSRNNKKEVMKNTHPKFVNCITNTLTTSLKVTEKDALSKLGYTMTRLDSGGKKQKNVVDGEDPKSPNEN